MGISFEAQGDWFRNPNVCAVYGGSAAIFSSSRQSRFHLFFMEIIVVYRPIEYHMYLPPPSSIRSPHRDQQSTTEKRYFSRPVLHGSSTAFEFETLQTDGGETVTPTRKGSPSGSEGKGGRYHILLRA